MPQLPILPVCPPVVTEWVVIERAADHLAPMAIIRGDGVADHVRLGLADDPHAARVDDILQDTGTGVVAGEYKHTVERHFRLLGFRLFPSQGIEGGHLFLIPFHLLRHGRPDLVVDRLHEHSRPRESTPFPEAGGATTKVCKLEKNHLPPYREPQRLGERGAQGGEPAQKEYIPLLPALSEPP